MFAIGVRALEALMVLHNFCLRGQAGEDVLLGDQPCDSKKAGEKVKAVTLVML
jgi:hypothetical protein